MADLRVLMLTPDFPPGHGGIQVLMHQLAAHFEYTRVKVLTLDAPHSANVDASFGLDVIRSPTTRLGGRRASIAGMNLQAPIVAAQFKPDVVLSGHIVCGPGAWLIRRALGIPYVQYLHSAEVADRPVLARFALERAEVAIAVSQHTEKLAVDLVRAERTPVRRIPPGVQLPTSVSDSQIASPLVVTISRMAERYKGLDVMIRALPLIRARVPDVLWAVLGDGPLRPTWEGLSHDLRQDGTVRFLGTVDDCERDWWLDNASVFALLSRPAPNGGGEGFGIVFLEAAARCLPVVAVRAAGVLDSVQDGVTGVLVDPLDHVGAAEAISSLLLDRTRAGALGRAGAARARDYAWPRIAQRVREVLAEAVAERKSKMPTVP